MTRSILVILFVCVTTVLRAQQPTEEIRVNEVFLRTPLSKALKIIQKKYDVRIAYDHAVVQNIIVGLQLNDLSITHSIERLLEGTPLTFHAVGNNVIIVRRPAEFNRSGSENKVVSLSGNVIDADSEETLPQATIRVLGAGVATTSNDDGYFTILNIPVDTCLLEIRYLGYLTQTIRVKALDNTDQLSIRLRSDTKILNEVVVMDEYNQPVHVEELPGASAFNLQSLSSLPSLGEQDIFRTLQLMPGVTATDESSSGMLIRGSHSSYNLTLLDGMSIYQQDHFFGSFSIINSDIIKDARVHKGMFDSKYGGRVSGVIDLTTKNGNAVKPSFNFKLNMINAKASAEIPLGKKWSLFAGVRRSFTDVLQSNLFNTLFDIAQLSNDQVQFLRFEGLGEEFDPRYYFFDTNSKLTFRPTSRDNISLSHFASRDRMESKESISLGDDIDRFVFDTEADTHWGNNGMSLRWGRQWSEKYYSNLRISNSRFFRRYDFDRQVELDMMSISYLLALENSIQDLSYSIDNEWLLSNKLSFDFGLSGIKQYTDFRFQDEYTFSGDSPPDEIPEDINVAEDEHSWLHSLYGSTKVSLTSKLTASGGARVVHYYNGQGQVYLEPRLTARYKITEFLNLKTGYGRSNQFVTQLFYYSPTGTISGLYENVWMISDPDDARYPVISSDHVTAGATLKQKQVVYDAEVYYKASRGVIIDEYLNSGNTNMYGLDIMVQKTSVIHKGWIAYSYGRGTQDHPDILNGRSMPSWQDQRHEIKVVNMVSLGSGNISSTLIYGSGKPNRQYAVQYQRDQSEMIYDYDLFLDYSTKSRLPAYFRIDLTASYKIKFEKSGEMELGLSIHNITGHRNIKTRKVDTIRLDEALFTYTELPVTYNDVVLPGFSPSLFLSFSF